MIKRSLLAFGVLFLALAFQSIYANLDGGMRDPIVINGNGEFTSENGVTSGSGTSDDPYIIANWTINAMGNYGISISNTTAHFVIRNCTIFGGTYGIYMSNVTNAIIENCTVYNNQYGIFSVQVSNTHILNNTFYFNTYAGANLLQANGIALHNNTFYNNFYGVKIEGSYDISFMNNTCYGCWNAGIYFSNSNNGNIYNNTCYNNRYGIYLFGSISNIIINNTCYDSEYGIHAIYSNNSNISNNTCYNSKFGIYLYHSNNTILNNNVLSNCGVFIIGYDNDVEGNTVNGRGIVYLEDVSDATIEDQDIGQVILVNCSNILIRNLNTSRASFGMVLFDSRNCNILNNVCHENYIGIFIESSFGIRVLNNTCYDNAFSAIYINNSQGNQLLNNTCYDNFPFNFSYGIYFSNSNDNNACNNTCYKNYYGIYLEHSNSSTLCNNTCYNNLHGISLYCSEGNELVDNICHNNTYGIVLDSSKGNTVSRNNCLNNTCVGIALLYCFDDNAIHQNTCYNNENGIHLLSSEKNSIENNLCYDNYNGISLEFSNNNTLCDNCCYNNTYAGMRLYNSNNNTLCNNTCHDNHYGIYLERSNNNVIRNNLLYDNVKDLEIIDSSGNIVEVPITPRAPIIISGNDQFTPENGVTLGSGTSDDPYIIANWTINAMGNYGISISNTTAHFIIRNCTIFNGTNGISLFNVTNAIIENCTIYNNQYGILFNQSVDNRIENNVCFNTHIGICLLYSENITVNNNTCYNNTNGIRLSNSNNNTLYNNTCYNNTHGIFLENSDYNNLFNNHCYQNNQSGIYINPSNNNEVVGNTCHNNYYGIFLNHSSYSDIADNKCHNNYYGIFLLNSDDNELRNNECYNNDYGIFLSGSDNNRLIYNYLHNNSIKDLELEKSLNNIVIAPYILPSPIDLPISIQRVDIDNYGNIANNGSHAIVVWHSNSSGNYDIWASLIELSPMKRIVTWQLTNDTNMDVYPFVTFINGSRILVTWSSNRSGLSQIYYKIYDNVTWSGDSQLTSGSEHLHSPIIQLSNGSLAIAYTSNASGFYDVWFSLLKLNGNTLELIGSKKLTSANETMKLLPSSMLQTEDGRLWIFAFDGYRYRDDFGETTQIYCYCSEDLQNWIGDVLIEGSGFARPSAVLLPNGFILIVFEGDDIERNVANTGWYVTFDGTYCSHPRLLSRGKSISLPSITYVANMNIIMASYQNWTNATYKMDLFFSYIPLPPVHAPITIVGNDQFTRENGVTSGSGTSGDPYIIENWIIYAWTGNGISISNTTAHFIIRNCTILYGGIKETPYFDGIWLSNVTNGVIANCSLCMDYYGIVVTKSSGLYIINNTFQGNSCDVSVYNSEKIEVIENDCYGDEAGILIGNSNGISIRDNALRNNRQGISISGSRGVYVGGNSLRNNTCGIYIYNSSGCEVIGNICRESDIELFNSNLTRIENNLCSEGNGIYLSNSNNTLICKNICYNNSYYGISVFNSILIKIQENNCTYNHIGIYLQRSNNSELKDNICRDGYIGVQAYRSKENYIESNDCSNNSIGIVLESSTQTWVRRNTCNGCSTGITLSHSDDNNIYHNTCCNGGSGIHLTYSNLNTLSNNTCRDNEVGIYLQGSRNNCLDSNTCCENRHGIYLTGSRDNEVLYNICRNNNGAGIYMRESTYNYVHHNSCNNNDNGIVLTDSCESNTISGNECLNNSYCGMYIEWSNHNHIHSNKCNENAGSLTSERIEAGITLFRSNNNRIRNNECKHNGNHGICLAYSDNNVVSANDCEFNSAAGIYVYNSNGNELSGNTCRNNGNGIVIYKSNRNGVHGNRVGNNGNAGINVSNAYSLNEIYENEIYRNRYAIYLYNSRNDTIRNNIIYENNYGVYLHSSSYNIIRNNAFYDNDVNWEEVGECLGNQKPPLITSFVPGRNASINRGSYYVMANYTDEDGINATAVRLIFDGADVTSSSEITADYAKYDFTVGDGLHAVNLFLVDNTENSIWYNWTFAVDSTPPSVIIISPKNITYVTKYVPINVSVTDPSGVSYVVAEINGIENYTLTPSNGYYVNSSIISFNEGLNIMRVYANDTLNNLNSTQYVMFIIDTTPPSITPVHPSLNQIVNRGNVTIIASFSDALSGISSMSMYIDGINVTENAIINQTHITYIPDPPLQDGQHEISIFALDNAGNSIWYNWMFTVDTTPPSVVIISPRNTTYATPYIPINVSVTDFSDISAVIAEINGISNYTLTLFNGYYVNSSTISFDQGSNVVRIYANDTLNNVNSSQYVVFTVDLMPPFVSSYEPANNAVTRNNRPTISANYSDASGVALIRIYVDGFNVTANASVEATSLSYTPSEDLSDGPHNVALFLEDNLGNSIWYNWTFTVDSLPPVIIPIWPRPDQTVDRGNVTIIASISDALSGISLVEVYIDGMNVTENAMINQTHVTYTPDPALRDGLHEASVFSLDMASNPTWHNWTFIVDAPLHHAYIYMNQTGGATIVIGTPVAFEIKAFNVHDYGKAGIEFIFFIENKPILTTPPTNADGITSFVHVFDTIPGGSIYAVNGSISTNVTSLIVVPPPPPIPDQIILGANVTQIKAGDSVIFTINATKSNNPLQDTFVYLYIDSILITTLGPTGLNGIVTYERVFPTIGTYNFTAKSYDGSVSSNTVEITVMPPPPINATVDLPANTEVRFDTDIFVSSFRLVANTDTDVSISIDIVDETVPGVVTFSSFNVSLQKDPTVSINMTVDFKVTQEWIIANRVNKSSVTLYHYNGTTWEPLETRYLSEDNNFVYYSAKVPSLSVFAIAGEGVVADNEPPTFIGFHPANNSFVNTLRPTITVNYSDNIGVNITTLVFKLDGMDVTNSTVKSLTSASYTPPIDLSEGPHRVYVSINDISNNSASIKWTFSIDVREPSIYSLTPANGSTVTTLTPTIFAEYQDPNGISVQSVIMMLNGSNVTPHCNISASNITYVPPPLINGCYYVVFLSVNDTANNRATIEWIFFVAVPDTTPPTISSLSPSNGSTITTTTPTISAMFSDDVAIDLSAVKIMLDGMDVTGSATITQKGFTYVPSIPLSQGTYTISLTVKDTSGNTAIATWSFTISIPAPPPLPTPPPPPPAPEPINGTSTSIIVSIVANAPLTVDVGMRAPMSSLRTIEILANESFPSARVSTEEYFDNPTTTPLPTGVVSISFIKIEVDVPSSAITQATIRFRVSKQALSSLRLDPSSVQLYRLNEVWRGLPTSLIAWDSEYYYFEAIAPGFSYFAITARPLPIDTIPPTIVSISPEDGALVTVKRPVIFVKYSDNMAIDMASVRLLLDGVDVTSLAFVNSSMVLFTPTSDLSEGIHSVYFEVKDASGNAATKTWSFTIKLPDTTPPIISSISPSNGSLVADIIVKISALYSDDVGIDVSSVVLSIDGKVVTPTKLNSSYVEFIAMLSTGLHTISLTVKDTSGNTAIATWSFTIKLPDVTPPRISIISPSNGTTLSTKWITINASFSDDVGIDFASIVLKLDGKDVTNKSIITLTGITYSTTLDEGLHTISLTVKDTSGNTAIATWSFTIVIPVDYTMYIVVALAIIAIIGIILILKRP